MLSTEQETIDKSREHYEQNKDALQLAVTVRNGCDTFMTFDKKLNGSYKSLPQLKIQLVK